MNVMQISAFIPFYSSEGENSTCILFNDGSKIDKPYSIKKCTNQILYSLHLDPQALSHWTYEVIGMKSTTPLIITDDIIFIPVKLRKSIGKHDGCFGFINMKAIASYDHHSILLDSGQSILTLSPKSYIQKKLHDAKLLHYAYLDHKKKYEFMWRK